MEISDKLCSGLVGVGQEVWKRKKIGGNCVFTWYHGPDDCTVQAIRNITFTNSCEFV